VNEAQCQCVYCDFEANEDGAVLISHSTGIFENCIFCDNAGYCGGLYIGHVSRSSITFIECHFEGNKGFSGVSHIYFENGSDFSASDCLFVYSGYTSIFLANATEYNVNLSFDCFEGFGRHLSLPSEHYNVRFVVDNLCFHNSPNQAVSGFFPNEDDHNISYNCLSCGDIHPESEIATTFISLSSSWTWLSESTSVSEFDSLSPSDEVSRVMSSFPPRSDALSDSISAVRSPSASLGATLEPDDTMAGWMIAIIVISVLIFVVLVILVLWKFVCPSPAKNKKLPIPPDRKDENPFASHNDHNEGSTLSVGDVFDQGSIRDEDFDMTYE
jgi:hypothetical protein